MYSWKKDPLTDKVVPILEDKHNHVIDALRYACEAARRTHVERIDLSKFQRGGKSAWM